MDWSLDCVFGVIHAQIYFRTSDGGKYILYCCLAIVEVQEKGMEWELLPYGSVGEGTSKCAGMKIELTSMQARHVLGLRLLYVSEDLGMDPW